MSDPRFTPIALIRGRAADPKTAIPETEWTDADRIALSTMHDLYDDIDGFRDTERNLQTRIGISEIGMDCDKCFMRKMAERPKNPDKNGSWKTQVGTYVHAGLEADFVRRWGDSGLRLAEGRLVVDDYKGRELSGSCDMFVPNLPEAKGGPRLEYADLADAADAFEKAMQAAPGVVVDWKIPSTDEDENGKLKPSSTMQKTINGKVSRQYLVQAMLYAHGWVRKGYNVTHTCIYFIPSFGQLWHAKPVLMRYDAELAAWGIARYRAAIDAMELFKMMNGGDETRAWDSVIDAQRKANFCFSCSEYEEMEQRMGFEGLTGPR